MKILFINSNLHGHINPTLGFVKKLSERGHEVHYFCGEDFSNQVIHVGAKWIGFSEELNRFLKEFKPSDRHPFYRLMEYVLSYDEVMLPQILLLIEKERYDVLVCDSIFGGVCFLKQMTDALVISSHSSFASSHAPVPSRMLEPGFHPQLEYCNQIVKRICEFYDLQEPSIEKLFISKGDLNVVYTTQTFNGDELVREPDYLFAGPSIERSEGNRYLGNTNYDTPGLDDATIGNRKLLYISLGSINTEFLDFYKLCIQAFADGDYYVCMSIGNKCKISQLGTIPKNFLVKNFFEQLEVLKRADAFITHAGFNSVNEALYYAVPMFAFPQVNDQPMVAKRLETMQLGLSGNIHELSVDGLKEPVKRLMEDLVIKENLICISEEIRRTADLDKVVKELEKFAINWKGKR